MTPREYLASLTPPLAIAGARGKFSRAALAELDRARKAGTVFDEPVHVQKKKEREAKVKPTTLPKASPAPKVDNSNLDPKTVRKWAIDNGVNVGARGRIHPDVYAAYRAAHTESEVTERNDAPQGGKDLREGMPRVRFSPRFAGTDIDGSTFTRSDRDCCICCGYSMMYCVNPQGPLVFSPTDVVTEIKLHGIR